MAERFTVDEDVVGSSPISHPHRGLLIDGGLFLLRIHRHYNAVRRDRAGYMRHLL